MEKTSLSINCIPFFNILQHCLTKKKKHDLSSSQPFSAVPNMPQRVSGNRHKTLSFLAYV